MECSAAVFSQNRPIQTEACIQNMQLRNCFPWVLIPIWAHSLLLYWWTHALELSAGTDRTVLPPECGHLRGYLWAATVDRYLDKESLLERADAPTCKGKEKEESPRKWNKVILCKGRLISGWLFQDLWGLEISADWCVSPKSGSFHA